MPNDDDNDSGNIFVTSHNQQGGITANQVNIGRPPPRDLRRASQAELDDILKVMEPHRDKNIGVTVSVNDAETQNFANQLRVFLGDNGFRVGPGIAIGIFSAPQPPLSIDSRRENEATVIVGPNNPNYPG